MMYIQAICYRLKFSWSLFFYSDFLLGSLSYTFHVSVVEFIQFTYSSEIRWVALKRFNLRLVVKFSLTKSKSIDVSMIHLNAYTSTFFLQMFFIVYISKLWLAPQEKNILFAGPESKLLQVHKFVAQHSCRLCDVLTVFPNFHITIRCIFLLIVLSVKLARTAFWLEFLKI